MARFFLPEGVSYRLGDPLPDQLLLTGEDAFHLSVSQRARIGDTVTVCTKEGVDLSCRILAISGGKKAPVVTLSPQSSARCDTEMPVSVTLYQGMPKGKKTDSILQKCTELGVSRVVFVYTDRAVPEPADDQKKIARFEKITKEASMQCGRGRLVQVSVLPNVESAVFEMKKNDISFACYEEEGERSIKDLIASPCKNLSFFIGPEGGFSQREAALFRENGIPTVTLGKRILRTETAGSAVLSMILYEKEL